MKKVFCTFAAFAVLGLASVSADIIAFNELSLRDTGDFAFGPDAADFTATFSEAATGSTFSLTAANQDLDGIGGLNDSFSFDLVITPSTGATAAQVSTSGIDVRSADNATESITLSVGNITVLTADDPTTAVNFNGFTGVGALSGNQANSFDIVSSTGTNLASFTFSDTILQDSVDFAANETTLVAVNASRTGGVIVVRDLDLEFHAVTTAVPEPSSLAVLGLLGGFMTLRRRK